MKSVDRCWVPLLALGLAACESPGPGESAGVPRVAAKATPAVAVVSSVDTGEELRGRELFGSYCTQCHSVDGRGLEALGVDLTTSRFVASRSDAELAAFLRRGRKPGDSDNRTGRQMPGVSMLPDMGEADVQALVAQVRRLNRKR